MIHESFRIGHSFLNQDEWLVTQVLRDIKVACDHIEVVVAARAAIIHSQTMFAKVGICLTAKVASQNGEVQQLCVAGHHVIKPIGIKRAKPYFKFILEMAGDGMGHARHIQRTADKEDLLPGHRHDSLQRRKPAFQHWSTGRQKRLIESLNMASRIPVVLVRGDIKVEASTRPIREWIGGGKPSYDFRMWFQATVWSDESEESFMDRFLTGRSIP